MIVDCLDKYGLLERHLQIALTDNCPKEALGARLLGTAEPAQTCRNHTLALVLQYALGSKLYKGAKAQFNNTAGNALICKKRKLVGHFKHSRKATAILEQHQLAELLKDDPGFPFDRPAKSLKKPRPAAP